MQADESCYSQTLLAYKPRHRRQSPALSETWALARPPQHPRRTIIQNKANIEPTLEPDGQAHLETVHLSDDSSHEYQNPCDVDENRSETEIDVDTCDLSKRPTSGGHHRSQVSCRQAQSPPPVVRISTTSVSRAVHLISRTQPNPRRIICRPAYSLPTF